MSQTVREVDPNSLRLPPSRSSGADAWTLQQQIRRFGSSREGMPPLFAFEDPDGILEISDGVTRITEKTPSPFHRVCGGPLFSQQSV